jgi:hypothetical protein
MCSGGVKQNNQGHAKKARPNRSNSQTKPPAVKESDCYAMGSYDNDPVVEPASTPSWMRSASTELPITQSPSSPTYPASPATPSIASRTNVVAPVPFHLPTYGTSTSTPMLAPFAQNMNNGSMSIPSMVAPPMVNNGAFGVNSMTPATGFPHHTSYMAPPASAPPSLAPTSTPQHTQDAIARILALQQTTASMTPSMDFSSPHQQPTFDNQNSVNFSRNLQEVQRNCGPLPQTNMAPPMFPTPIGNPFAAMSPAATTPIQQQKPIQSITASSPFAAAAPQQQQQQQHTNGTAVSLEHLMSMQQQLNQTRQSMDQFKPQPSSRASPVASDSLWQLQQQFSTGTGKPVQLSVSSDGTLKVANGHSSSNADFLFEPAPPANNRPIKTSGKHIPSPRSAPIHAHHNYGVPAQP